MQPILQGRPDELVLAQHGQIFGGQLLEVCNPLDAHLVQRHGHLIKLIGEQPCRERRPVGEEVALQRRRWRRLDGGWCRHFSSLLDGRVVLDVVHWLRQDEAAQPLREAERPQVAGCERGEVRGALDPGVFERTERVEGRFFLKEIRQAHRSQQWTTTVLW